jgi:hypothetical protein
MDPDPEHCLTQTSVDFYTLCCSMATGMHFRLEQLTVFLPDYRQWDNGACSEGLNSAPQKYFIQYIWYLKPRVARGVIQLVESDNVIVMFCNIIILYFH